MSTFARPLALGFPRAGEPSGHRSPARKDATDMKKKLKELFIEDLGQVNGGRAATTLALGEEGPYPSTDALGEEDPYTTIFVGEEETTHALGEEEPIPVE